MKKMLTELILCLYNKLTQGLCDLIQAILDKALDLAGLEDKAKAAAANSNGDDDSYRRLAPKVPPCYAEDITAQVFAVSAPAINEANESLVQNLDNFLEDMQKQLAGVSGALDGMMNKIPDISGSLTAALGFENIRINLFGCELEPNCPVDDYYTIQGGGAGQPDAKQPSDKAVEDAAAAQDPAEVASPQPDPGYIQPTSGQQDTPPSGSQAPPPPPPPPRQPDEVLLYDENYNTPTSTSTTPPPNETPAQREARRRAKVGNERYEEIQRRREAAIRAGQEGG
tara:strand:- start:19 stop:867 length:849 start_codon:yes stop_codon:yes gene_type:complete